MIFKLLAYILKMAKFPAIIFAQILIKQQQKKQYTLLIHIADFASQIWVQVLMNFSNTTSLL